MTLTVHDLTLGRAGECVISTGHDDHPCRSGHRPGGVLALLVWNHLVGVAVNPQRGHGQSVQSLRYSRNVIGLSG